MSERFEVRNPNKTTVIVCAFDNFKWQRHITFAVLNCLRRFTNTDDYELIMVDTGDKGFHDYTGGPYNRWEIIKPDKHIKTDDIGYSAAMNLGVKSADPFSRYFVFMHNDVFVQEFWLPTLRAYLENKLCEVIYPDQIARHRETMEEIYRTNEGGGDYPGHDEAGLIMMSRDAYNSLGGWDDDFKSVLQDLALHKRYEKAGVKKYCTTKTFITHVGSIGYAHDDTIEKANREKESNLIIQKYGSS